MPRLFRHGGERRFVFSLWVATLTYGAIAGTVLWAVAPTVLGWFGSEYVAAADAVHAAALLVPFLGLRMLGGNVLMSRGKGSLQARLQLSGIALLALLAPILMPRYGLPGCIHAMLVVEVLLALAFWITIAAVPSVHAGVREPQSATAPSAPRSQPPSGPP